jgi:hypothetical protein
MIPVVILGHRIDLVLRAPQLQPDVTAHDTPGVHALLMRRTEQKSQGVATATAEALPELKPWREVGWIFRDGDCIAIERKGEETRARVLVD